MPDTLDPALEAALDPKALEASYAAVEKLPLRDMEHIGGELDRLRSHEGARAAVRAYLAAASPQAEIDRLREALREIALLVHCWDALPSGNYSPRIVERWLVEVMAPAINNARALHPETPNGGQNA